MNRKYRQLILVVYGILMLWLLFGQRMAWSDPSGLQLVPMETLKLYLGVLRRSSDSALRMQAWANLLGNVAMFIPLGFLLPWIWEKWREFWRHTLLMAAIILAVEATQLVSGLGWCDVDDLILNLFGTTLGFLFWKWISRTRWV